MMPRRRTPYLLLPLALCASLLPTAVYGGVLVNGERQPLAGKTLRLIVADSDTVAAQDWD